MRNYLAIFVVEYILFVCLLALNSFDRLAYDVIYGNGIWVLAGYLLVCMVLEVMVFKLILMYHFYIPGIYIPGIVVLFLLAIAQLVLANNYLIQYVVIGSTDLVDTLQRAAIMVSIWSVFLLAGRALVYTEASTYTL